MRENNKDFLQVHLILNESMINYLAAQLNPLSGISLAVLIFVPVFVPVNVPLAVLV